MTIDSLKIWYSTPEVFGSVLVGAVLALGLLLALIKAQDDDDLD